ncbi:MAG: sulfotransferase [Dehalococcoidia bacterium]|nr:sulfotransferase [Dehalococcoidia bacterium]
MTASRVDDFLQSARAATGLNDFGESEDFLVGLRIICADLGDAPNVEGAARERLLGAIDAALATRLRLVEERKAVPAVCEEAIEGPLVLIGLPRTGTTALVDLLAQDPAARAPTQWENGNLFPPPKKAEWASDPRIAELQARLDAEAPHNPMVAMGLHAFGAMLPDECNAFTGLEFWSPNLAVLAHLPRYSEWLRWASPARPYRAHKWVLQHMQHFGPGGRWLLKSPFHVHALPALVAEYPDAVFVQTHRDPKALMPSMCGLYSTIRGEGPGDPRRAITGAELCRVWGAGMQRAMAARLDPALNARVFDVSHRAMIEDPLGTLRSVYDHFRLPFTAAAEAAARAWLANPAQHMSKVKFTLEEYGLTEAQVEDAFGPYAERFKAYF